GLATKLTSRLGLRPIAEQLAVPHTTVRSWWQRFRVRSPMLLAQCTALAAALDGTAVDVNAGAVNERAALDVLSVVWQRARARFGERMGSPWSFWSPLRMSKIDARPPGRSTRWISSRAATGSW